MWHLYLLQYHVYWHMTVQRVPAMQNVTQISHYHKSYQKVKSF